MSQKSIKLVVILLFLIVAGMFIYANLKKTELQNSLFKSEIQKNKTEISPYVDVVQNNAKHYFIANEYASVGKINMPIRFEVVN